MWGFKQVSVLIQHHKEKCCGAMISNDSWSWSRKLELRQWELDVLTTHHLKNNSIAGKGLQQTIILTRYFK